MNNLCYYYENIILDKGMFDNSIDCAYILTMENSSRKEQYMNQINKYKPCKNIIIQYNKGFKLCKKKLYKDLAIYDLNDAYYYAYKHAKENKYENIIIFEDDFFFDETINQEIVDSIGYFIKNNNYHIYSLGTIPHIFFPTLSEHNRVIYMSCTHALIYNKSYFDIYCKLYEEGLSEQNDLIMNKFNIIRYGYYKPLCFQIFTETENRQTWKFKKLCVFFINLFKMGKTHKYWNNVYYCNYIIWLILILILTIILYYIKLGK